ncbi:unnamed protein product [Linum tenue]|uniref:Uncharacterized protein n=1 Tax=Linum tenue TaxID=586396 RepID=A0AAV0S3S3_9ROSI|nr:unnamed protein product [Linum tenue]
MGKSIIGMPWRGIGSSLYSITCGVIQRIITSF